MAHQYPLRNIDAPLAVFAAFSVFTSTVYRFFLPDIDFNIIVKQKWFEENAVVLRTKSLTLIPVNYPLICH